MFAVDFRLVPINGSFQARSKIGLGFISEHASRLIDVGAGACLVAGTFGLMSNFHRLVEDRFDRLNRFAGRVLFIASMTSPT